MKEEFVNRFQFDIFEDSSIGEYKDIDGDWHEYRKEPISEQNVHECDATAAQSTSEPLSQKNPLEDITECYIDCSKEEAEYYLDKEGDLIPVKRITLPAPAVGGMGWVKRIWTLLCKRLEQA